jgi:hypothetical protein
MHPSIPNELLVAHQFETDLGSKLSDLVKRGIQAKIARGEYPGCAPIGYRNCRTGGRAWVEIDPVMGPLIREAFVLMATGKYSLRQLATTMTEKGLRSKHGKSLSSSSLHHLLTNRFYTGVIISNGRSYLGKHAPLVSHATFARVQARLTERRCR